MASVDASEIRTEFLPERCTRHIGERCILIERLNALLLTGLLTDIQRTLSKWIPTIGIRYAPFMGWGDEPVGDPGRVSSKLASSIFFFFSNKGILFHFFFLEGN